MIELKQKMQYVRGLEISLSMKGIQKSLTRDALLVVKSEKKKKLMKEIEDSIAHSALKAKEEGIKGLFTCPSCLKKIEKELAIRDEETLLRFCSDCFRTWADLYMSGRIVALYDLIPQNREC